MRARVFHRHELVQVLGIEGPGIHHLGAVGVDHLDPLALGDARSLAAASRNCLHRLRVHRRFVPFPRWRLRLVDLATAAARAATLGGNSFLSAAAMVRTYSSNSALPFAAVADLAGDRTPEGGT